MAVADSDWRSHGDDLCGGRHQLKSAGRFYYVLREEDYVKLVGGDEGILVMSNALCLEEQVQLVLKQYPACSDQRPLFTQYTCTRTLKSF